MHQNTQVCVFLSSNLGKHRGDSQTVGFLFLLYSPVLPFLPRTAASAEPDGGGQVLKGFGRKCRDCILRIMWAELGPQKFLVILMKEPLLTLINFH